MLTEIAIFDTLEGTVDVVLRTQTHMEAPNWTPDGAALIINSEGLLYRLPLDTGEPTLINTGPARRINNDHGISPDGTQLVISDQTEDGDSRVYILPIGGGTPKLVTEKAPSYWHGWSPDSTHLAYVANRGAGYQVYLINTKGGAERQVTSGFDHCDGPDFSPDGEWIWFNAEVAGSVDIWRIRPDGRDAARITSDANVNWFPHPSPDGSQVLFLAYPPGTKGHPQGLDVVLRMMPALGGTPRDLLALRGGQGTINVPCWAPDSRRFAFARYPVS